MDIHLGFEPDAARAALLDRRMHDELAASLRYVVDQARGSLDFDEQALLAVSQALEAGKRVTPVTFGRYYDLVSALMEGDAEGATHQIHQLTRFEVAPAGMSFTRLRDPADCELSSFYLQKFLEGSEGDLVVQPPPAPVAERFAHRFARGMNLMRQSIPELAGEVEAIIRDVVAVVGDPNQSIQIDGGSHYQLWGALFLNADFHETDAAMAEVIAHESGHSLLFGLTTEHALVLNDDDNRYPSPLRSDLRPMNGIYHATFVSARMCWAMSRLLESGQLDAEQRAQVIASRDADLVNFRAGLSVVREHGELTEIGRELMAGAQAWVASQTRAMASA